MIGYIIGKNGKYTKKMLDDYSVVMRFEKAPKINYINYKKTDMCVMNGRMDNI